MRPILRLLALLALVSFASVTTAAAQAEDGRLCDYNPVAPGLFSEFISKTAGLLSEDYRTAWSDACPIFVFIPGFMGSSLKDGEHIIWGRPSSRSLHFAPEAPARSGPLHAYYLPGNWVAFNYAAHIRALGRSLMDAHGGPGFAVFHYDWRQSNASSARDLNRWLCDMPEVQNRPVVFLAHSMGGLVLKAWLKFHLLSTGQINCSGQGRPIRVSHIVFAGTPHLGAPKMLRALESGFSLLLGSVPFVGAIAPGNLDPTSMRLNRYAHTFESVYELLPLSASNAPCLPELDGRKSETVQALDVFNASTWERMGWPKHTPGLDRTKYLATYLPERLAHAQAFLCDTLNLSIPADIRVAYFAGARLPTDDGIEIYYEPEREGLVARVQGAVADILGRARPSLAPVPTVRYLKRPGDGTVPLGIATNEAYRSAHATSLPVDVVSLDADHNGILTSPELRTYIEALQADSAKRMKTNLDARSNFSAAALLRRLNAEWRSLQQRVGLGR